MRIEQYFLMTDYLPWEVILNGDSLVLTRVIEGVVQPDAKTLMEAIEKRFGGNKEIKKVQKTLLKQQYENFIGSSSESLHEIHDRLQKLINQLEILGESLSQEDINLKFLRSLPTKWRTHTLIWRNKIDLEDQSLDDLFSSLKIYEAEVKSSSSASTSTQNIAFVSSKNTDSTNEPVSDVASVSAASAKIPISALPNVDTLSNAVIYSFFASQSNSPQLDNDDLKQIDADDLEEIDLKWQMAMLTVRARQFLQRTGQNLGVNGPTSMRSPKDTRRNVQLEPQRRSIPVETSTSNALVYQCDGVGSYDWSFQPEEEPTNYARMAFTSSSSSSSDNEIASCSKACTKAYDTLQSHYDKLSNDLRKSQFDVISYKTGLESVEARLLNLSQLLASQTNDKTGLGYDTQVFTSSMFDCDEMFTSETDESFPASPIYDRYQSGEGYHAVPPPYTGTFMPPKPDLAFHDAPNVNETLYIAFNVELSPTKPGKDLSHTHRPSAPIIKDWVSDSEDDSDKLTQNALSFVQPTEQVKTLRPSVKPVERYIPAANPKTDIPKPKSNGNSRNRKACFVCKSLTYLIKDCDYYKKKMAHTPARDHAQRGKDQHYTKMSLLNPQRHVVPTAVLTQSKLVLLTVARQVTTVVLQPHVTRLRPAKTIVTKPHSPPRRTINRRPSPPASNFPPKVTTTEAPKVNDVKGVQGNWVWKPKCSILDHVSCHTSASMTLKRFDYNDALGRSKIFLEKSIAAIKVYRGGSGG
nr:hypothetical protein [Tanacetum cinerariifolium]